MKISLETIRFHHRAAIVCGAALLMLVSTVVTSTADAQTIIYSDDFARTTGSGLGNGEPAGANMGSSDWGTADNGSGGTATVAWSAGRLGSPTGGAQFTTNGTRAHLFEGAANTTFNAAAVAPDGFTIEFDFNRIDTALVAAPTNGFLSVGTGYDQSVNEFSPFETTGNSQFAVLFQQAANGNAANGNVFIDGVSQGTFNYVDPVAEHNVLLAFTPAVTGAYGASDVIAASVTVDGTSVYSANITGGGDFGDLSFATNLFTAAYIENLVVTANPSQIPEPSSLALLGWGGLAMVQRRRR